MKINLYKTNTTTLFEVQCCRSTLGCHLLHCIALLYVYMIMNNTLIHPFICVVKKVNDNTPKLENKVKPIARQTRNANLRLNYCYLEIISKVVAPSVITGVLYCKHFKAHSCLEICFCAWFHFGEIGLCIH